MWEFFFFRMMGKQQRLEPPKCRARRYLKTELHREWSCFLSCREAANHNVYNVFIRGCTLQSFIAGGSTPRSEPLTMDNIMGEHQPLPEETHLFSSRRRYTEITTRFSTRSYPSTCTGNSYLFLYLKPEKGAAFRRVIGCIPRPFLLTVECFALLMPSNLSTSTAMGTNDSGLSASCQLGFLIMLCLFILFVSSLLSIGP